LDAPGALHHVIGRGIERTKIFQTDTDRTDFVERLAALCQQGHMVVFAWALMPNHFHLLVRAGTRPLAQSMKRLLTGYVVNFNRKHKRYGHLFQNRYKSILCEEDTYLLELTRYIHLNPLRGGLVRALSDLRKYPWTGHAALLGMVDRAWQETDTVLAYFGQKRRRALQRYETFIREGIAQGRRPELVGGGLIRSLGGWAQVLSLRRKGSPVASDTRILGSGDFVEMLLVDAARQEKETLRLRRKVIDLATLGRQIQATEDVAEGELRSGIRTKALVRARRLFCQLAVQGMGYSGAEVARFLGVTTSAVNRLAVSPKLPEVRKYLKAL
jgi:REP element-mobilizing transposase RayT